MIWEADDMGREASCVAETLRRLEMDGWKPPLRGLPGVECGLGAGPEGLPGMGGAVP